MATVAEATDVNYAWRRSSTQSDWGDVLSSGDTFCSCRWIM